MTALGTYVITLRLMPAFTANLARDGVMAAISSRAREGQAPSVDDLAALGVEADFARVFVARLQYLLRLREAGLLISAGPFADLTEGLYLCRAADEAAARRVLEDDPLFRAGFIARDFSVRRWLAAI